MESKRKSRRYDCEFSRSKASQVPTNFLPKVDKTPHAPTPPKKNFGDETQIHRHRITSSRAWHRKSSFDLDTTRRPQQACKAKVTALSTTGNVVPGPVLRLLRHPSTHGRVRGGLALLGRCLAPASTSGGSLSLGHVGGGLCLDSSVSVTRQAGGMFDIGKTYLMSWRGLLAPCAGLGHLEGLAVGAVHCVGECCVACWLLLGGI